MAEFYERLRELRQSAGLRQVDVAKRLDMTINNNPRSTCGTTCYGYYERGLREPNIEKIKKICVLFSCDANYLLGLTDDPWTIPNPKTLQDFSTDELLAELKRRWNAYE